MGDRRDGRGTCAVAIVGMKLRAAAVLPEQRRGPSWSSSCDSRKALRSPRRPSRSRRWKRCSPKDEDVRFFTAYTGAGQPRFYLSLNPELPNPGYAVFIVMTKDMEARETRALAPDGDASTKIPARVGARHAARARPAGRLPGAVPRRRPGHAEGARDRARGRSGGRVRARRCATSSSTGTTRFAR